MIILAICAWVSVGNGNGMGVGEKSRQDVELAVMIVMSWIGLNQEESVYVFVCLCMSVCSCVCVCVYVCVSLDKDVIDSSINIASICAFDTETVRICLNLHVFKIWHCFIEGIYWFAFSGINSRYVSVIKWFIVVTVLFYPKIAQLYRCPLHFWDLRSRGI